jgi:hypothetical protein
MTVTQVREIDPGFCDRLQAVGLPEPILCGPYLYRTIGGLAQAEHVDLGILLEAVQAEPAAPVETNTQTHRHPQIHPKAAGRLEMGAPAVLEVPPGQTLEVPAEQVR